jgi:hypothetical protein
MYSIRIHYAKSELEITKHLVGVFLVYIMCKKNYKLIMLSVQDIWNQKDSISRLMK